MPKGNREDVRYSYVLNNTGLTRLPGIRNHREGLQNGTGHFPSTFFVHIEGPNLSYSSKERRWYFRVNLRTYTGCRISRPGRGEPALEQF